MEGFWSKEDGINAKALIKRTSTDESGTKIMVPPLNRQETAWATDFIWRSILWDLTKSG